MIDFKLRYVSKGLLPFMIGQFLSMNVPCPVAATRQSVDVPHPIYEADGSTSTTYPVHQKFAADQAEALFCISGTIPKTICFTAIDLAQLPRTSLVVRDRDGTRTTYAGVLLREILQQADVPQGKQLRGANLARYLVVEGKDGYAVVFGLPEFDPAFGNRVVLLADRRNGHALTTDEAPLRLVIPDDQRRARWVRQINQMRVMQAVNPPPKS